ncbi:MAG: hypothetical protein ACREEM_32500 [Blastocatellia bacterium]
MIPVPDNEAAATALYEIERALLDVAGWELYIGDRFAGAMDRGNFDFSLEWGKLIFAWWDDANSQSWRVSAYERDGAELRLQASRGLDRERAILTLRDPAGWREAQEAEARGSPKQRKEFARSLARLLAATPGGAKVLRAGSGEGRAGKLTAAYARLVLEQAEETILAIGLWSAGTQAEIDGIVAAGLVWLSSYNINREPRLRASRLIFCLPRDRAQTVIERLAWIDVSHEGARIQCFEVDPTVEILTPVQPVTQYELLNVHPRNVIWPGAIITDDRWHARILALSPDLIEARQLPGREGESYSIHGLEFARVLTTGDTEKRQVRFGVPGCQDEGLPAMQGTLTESNFGELERLVREIVRCRSAKSDLPRHPFYRLREEAWLESLLRRDIRVLDAALDARFVYSQIPTWRGEQRSVIDLLGMDHEGRLAVIEIKASEDAQLPMQGLDYWVCVEQARLRGEFQRRGLFPGVKIADRAPLLYLVAPRLRFHRTFATVAAGLSGEIEAYQIGINQNWRAGVQIRTRERVNAAPYERNQTESDGVFC